MTVRITGDEALDRFFATITPKLQRGALRKGVRAAGSALVKEIRQNLSTMVSTKSASRNRANVRLDNRGKKTSLKKTIGQRAWSKPRAGIIGTVVGARWPEGAHAHLVEFGHEVVSHGKRTGKRTQPIPFQRTAERTARPQVLAAQRKKLREALQRVRAK